MSDRTLGIAVIADTFPATSETFVSSQVLGLARRGHRIQVLAERRPLEGDPVRQGWEHPLGSPVAYVDLPSDVEAGLSVWPLSERCWPPGSPDPLPNVRRLGRALPALARSLAHAPGVTRDLLSPRQFGVDATSLATIYRADAARRLAGGIDVAHAHFGPVANNFRFLPRLWRSPLVVTFHGYDFSSWPVKHGADCFAPLFRSAAAVTVNSQHARSRLVNLGCPPELLHRLNIGIDLHRSAYRARRWSPGETLRLLTVGRLTEKKGHETALRAVARLVRSGVGPVRYDVIGGGPQHDRLQALVRDLGLAHVVRLHGAQPAELVQGLMDEAHLFVLASRTAANGDEEGTPVVLLEAQASGLPIVSTRHAGIPEIVQDGVAGRLVVPGDDRAMAEALRELVARPEEWPTLGGRGRAYVVAHHDAEKLLDALVELYRRVREGYRCRSSGAVGCRRTASGGTR